MLSHGLAAIAEGSEERAVMVHLTEAAAAELRGMLKQCRASPGAVVRLAWDGRLGIERTIGLPEPEDEVCQDAQGPVLAVEHALADRLAGLVFDYQLSRQGRGEARMEFTLRKLADNEVEA